METTNQPTLNGSFPSAPIEKREDYLGLPWASDVFDAMSRLPQKLNLDRALSRLADSPGQNYVGMIALASAIFYRVEKNHNPKVHDIWDSLVYCSTCCSVGYGDIFAHTPLGKVIGSLLMTIGPAMSSRAVDGPGSLNADTMQREVLATLRQIHAQLQPSGCEETGGIRESSRE